MDRMNTETEEFPYNNKNVLIDEEDVNKILRTFGIKFKCLNYIVLYPF